MRKLLPLLLSLSKPEMDKTKKFILLNALRWTASIINSTYYTWSCKRINVSVYALGKIWFKAARPWHSLIYKPPLNKDPDIIACADLRWHVSIRSLYSTLSYKMQRMQIFKWQADILAYVEWHSYQRTCTTYSGVPLNKIVQWSKSFIIGNQTTMGPNAPFFYLQSYIRSFSSSSWGGGGGCLDTFLHTTLSSTDFILVKVTGFDQWTQWVWLTGVHCGWSQ